jgi:outer membrane protein assembly factor BamB
MKKTFSLGCFFFLFVLISNAQPNAVLTWSYLPPIDSFGKAGMVTTDINNDGKAELIYTSNDSSHTVLRMMQAREGLPGIYFRCNAPLLYTRPHHIGLISNSQGIATELCLSAADGAVYTFSAETLTPADTLDPGMDIHKFLQVNLGVTHRIAALSDGILYLLNENWQVLATFDEIEVTDIAVGDVDLDGVPEIVTGGEEGFVLDASNLEGENGLEGGFGDQVCIQEQTPGSPALIIGYSRAESGVRAYDGSNLNLLWEVNQGHAAAHTLVFGDINGDGQQDLMVGNSSQGIRAYDMANQNMIKHWSVNYSISFEGAAADFNGDGVVTMVIGNHQSSSNRIRQLAAYDFDNSEEIWESEEHGENTAFGLADTNGDGYPEKLVSGIVTSMYDYPTVSVLLDGQTGALLDHHSLGSLIRPSYDVAGLEQNGVTYFATAQGLDVSLEQVNEAGLNTLPYLGINSVEWVTWLLPQPGYSKTQFLACYNDCHIFPFEEGLLTYVPQNQVPRLIPAQFGRQPGYFDNSGRPQLFQYTGDSVLIVNLDSIDVARRFSLTGGPIDPGLSVGDVNADGVLEAVYKSDAGEGVFFNLTTGDTVAFPLGNWSEVKFEALRLANIDEDPELEIGVLTESRFLLFDHDFTLLFESQPLSRPGNPNLQVLKLTSGDFDLNGHMDFLCTTIAGVFQFEANTAYTDWELPTVTQYTPLQSTYLPPTDTVVAIFFSEDILEGSLGGNIEVVDVNEELISFDLEYDSLNRRVLLRPQDEWPADTVYIRLSPQITDLNNNPLDGNFNTLPDGQSDAFLICLPLGSGKDEQGPQLLQGALIADTLIRFEPLAFTGIFSDSSGVTASELAYAEYFVDADTVVPGTGVFFPPSDGQWDVMAEPFSFSLLTNALDTGFHSITLLAKDSRGNWGSPEVFSFWIKPSETYLWPSEFHNQLNTSATSQSKTQPPLRPRFVIDLPVEFFQANRALLSNVVVADSLLFLGSYPTYGEPAVLEARSLLDGEAIWSIQEPVPGLPYPLHLAHDRIYYILDEQLKSKNLSTGESLWEVPSLNNFSIFEDRIIHHTETDEYELQATNAFTGEKIWSVAVPSNSVWSSHAFPVFYQDTMYSLFQEFQAISPETGNVHYTNDEIERGLNAPLVLDSSLHQVFVSSLFSIQAIDLETQSVNWVAEAFGLELFKNSPLYHRGKLFLKTTLGLQSRNSGTGELLWSYDWSQYMDSSYPMVANDSTVYVSGNGLTYAFDMDSGELLQRFNAAGPLSLTDSLLVISDLKNGRLVVLEPGTTDYPPLEAEVQILSMPDCANYFGGAVEVIANGGTGDYTYHWGHSDYIRGSVAESLAGDQYSVIVTDLLLDSVVLEFNIPDQSFITASFEVTHCDEGQMNGAIEVQAVSGGHPPYNYDWSRPELPDTSYISGLAPGTYILTITDQMNCIRSYQVVVQLISTARNSESGNTIMWYPSPTTGWITEERTNSYSEVEVTVWNNHRQICHQQFFHNHEQLRLDLSGCPAGLYWVESIINGRRHIQKIVKVNP